MMQKHTVGAGSGHSKECRRRVARHLTDRGAILDSGVKRIVEWARREPVARTERGQHTVYGVVYGDVVGVS